MSKSPNAALIRSIAEPLRGDYKQSDYGKVILPFTLLRRLDCVLAPTKAAVLAEYERRKNLAYDISSAAVTGKIDVREALTPNPSPVATGEGS